jgi:hypothetical protein
MESSLRHSTRHYERSEAMTAAQKTRPAEAGLKFQLVLRAPDQAVLL